MSADVSTLELTTEQWREELMKFDRDDPGLSANELADACGLPLRTVQQRLRKLLKTRGCKRGFAIRLDSLGRRQRVPVYQLLPGH